MGSFFSMFFGERLPQAAPPPPGWVDPYNEDEDLSEDSVDSDVDEMSDASEVDVSADIRGML